MSYTTGQIVAWNTGRKYTENGQRIAARYTLSEIQYVDVDRSIEGSVPFTGWIRDADDLKTKVMAAYDNGLGTHHLPAHARVDLTAAARRCNR